MPMPTPAQYAKNWSRGMSGSADKLRAGVNAVTESPTHKAALAIDRQVAGVVRAAQEGRTQRALEKVTTEDWKRAMNEKGIPRIAQGAAGAENKVAAFAAEFLPFVASGVASLPPRGDLETNIQRSISMQRHNAAFRRNR